MIGGTVKGLVLASVLFVLCAGSDASAQGEPAGLSPELPSAGAGPANDAASHLHGGREAGGNDGNGALRSSLAGTKMLSNGEGTKRISIAHGQPLDMMTPPPLTIPPMKLDIETPRLATGDDIRRAVADINRTKKEENERRRVAEEALRASIGLHTDKGDEGHAGGAGPPLRETVRANSAMPAPQPPPLPCQDEKGDMAMLSPNCMREMGVIQSANALVTPAPRGYVAAESLSPNGFPNIFPSSGAPESSPGNVQCIVAIFTQSGGVPPTHFWTKDVRECLAASTHMNYGVPGVSNITMIGDGLGVVQVSCTRPAPDGATIECAKK